VGITQSPACKNVTQESIILHTTLPDKAAERGGTAGVDTEPSSRTGMGPVQHAFNMPLKFAAEEFLTRVEEKFDHRSPPDVL